VAAVANRLEKLQDPVSSFFCFFPSASKSEDFFYAIMGRFILGLVLGLCAISHPVHSLNTDLRIGSGGQTIQNFLREIESNPEGLDRRSLLAARDVDPETLYPKRYFEMPVDHFPHKAKYEPHTTRTFQNRYWFDDTYYKPGGPVIILQSGETNGLNRLVYMQKGILQQLAKATNGMSVVFEHRYYGYSFPTRYLTTKDLRFLTTEQALADEAYFAKNIVFPGYEDHDLTSDATPWISYGGSYAGAFSAFLRVKYPEIFWGAISSSGVTKAIYNYWQYYDPVAEYGPAFAMATQKLFVEMIDTIVIKKADNKALTQKLKAAFGMPNVTHVADFTNQLAQGVGWWQSLNWECVCYIDLNTCLRRVLIFHPIKLAQKSAIPTSTNTAATSPAPTSCIPRRSPSARPPKCSSKKEVSIRITQLLISCSTTSAG
jgi:hypothetical protein